MLSSNRGLDFKSAWNIFISYNPQFAERYHKSLVYINKIKEAFNDNDMLSILTYTDNKLKRSIDKKRTENINFDDNIDMFLSMEFSKAEKYSVNIFQRLNEYLRLHYETVSVPLRAEVCTVLTLRSS